MSAASFENRYSELVRALVKLNVAFARKTGYSERQIKNFEETLNLLERKLVPATEKQASARLLIEDRDEIIDQLTGQSPARSTGLWGRFLKSVGIAVIAVSLLIGTSWLVTDLLSLSLRDSQVDTEVASVFGQNETVVAENESAPPIPEHPLEPLAEEGDPYVQYKLASFYIKGIDVEQSYERARYWFERAANQGIAGAQYNLAVMLHQELGVNKDIETALFWYQQAAVQGHAEAAYNLAALCADNETPDALKDYQKARKFFAMAYDGGVVRAAHDVGQLYESGYITEGNPDIELAQEWYNKSAAKGYAPSFASLSRLADQAGSVLNQIETAAP